MATAHRAAYLFERGSWRARCRECGFEVVDRDRRRATGQFRFHIRDMKVRDLLIDLTPSADVVALSPAQTTTQ